MTESISPTRPQYEQPILFSLKASRSRILLLAAIFFCLDITSKQLLRHVLMWGASVTIIPQVLAFTMVQNKGAAWSLLQDMPYLLAGIAAIFSIALLVLIFKKTFSHKLEWIILGLLLGGTMGNLLDRLQFGSVTDFIHLLLFPTYPVFNIADIWICSAVSLIFFGGVKGLWQKN